MRQRGDECDFAIGFSWDLGCSDSLSSVIDALQETLADYHVCNNDAALQAELWRDLADNQRVGACDTSTATCQGPMWFYDP